MGMTRSHPNFLLSKRGWREKMLDKKKILFERNEQGELMPKTVKLVGTDEEIKITPLTRAEFIKYQSEGNEVGKDQQKEIILKHLVEPKLDEKEFEALPMGYALAFFGTILKHSGLNIEKNEKTEAGDALGDFTKGKVSEDGGN